MVEVGAVSVRNRENSMLWLQRKLTENRRQPISDPSYLETRGWGEYDTIFCYLPLNWTNLGGKSLVMNITDLAFRRRIALTYDKPYLRT